MMTCGHGRDQTKCWECEKSEVDRLQDYLAEIQAELERFRTNSECWRKESARLSSLLRGERRDTRKVVAELEADLERAREAIQLVLSDPAVTKVGTATLEACRAERGESHGSSKYVIVHREKWIAQAGRVKELEGTILREASTILGDETSQIDIYESASRLLELVGEGE